jgi:hypothetical protein
MRRAFLLAGCLLLQGGAWADPVLRPGGDVAFSTPIPSIDEIDTPVQMLDVEFDPSLLENLPAPAALPPPAGLPRVVADKTQWKGSLSGITRFSRIVIRSSDTWTRFWTSAIAPYSPQLKNLPDVDFSKDMVVGVFMGEKPDPGYTIEIRSAKAETVEGGPGYMVRYKNRRQMQAVFAPPFKVQPFHLKKVPRFDGRITFQEPK